MKVAGIRAACLADIPLLGYSVLTGPAAGTYTPSYPIHEVPVLSSALLGALLGRVAKEIWQWVGFT
jgi:hypothetical protein